MTDSFTRLTERVQFDTEIKNTKVNSAENQNSKMVEKFAEALTKHQKPGLITHINPDGDAVGSQLALYYWLQQQGQDPLLFNDDPVPANLRWLRHYRKIQIPDETLLDQCDGFLFIDGNRPSRFGEMATYFEETKKPVYLIDHHLDPPDDFFKSRYWDPSASSTAFLVYKLFEFQGLENMTKDVAEALYCGIVTDTGSFRFDTVTAGTHFAIGNIIKYGEIHPGEIHSRIYDDKTLSQYHLLGKVLNNILLFCDNLVAITSVTQEMLSETGCSYEDLEDFVNYPLSIKGVSVSVLLCEREDRIKISFRGKSRIDLNQVARNFKGGGHHNAAGAWHPGPLDQAIDVVVAELASYLDTNN